MASPWNWQVSFTAALLSILDEQFLGTWWIKHKPMAEHEFLGTVLPLGSSASDGGCMLGVCGIGQNGDSDLK
jgi:hypothetical protein